LPKLTKRIIDALEPNSGRRRILWDSALPGFGCLLHPSGRRVYVVQYRTLAGRSRRLALGAHGVLTPEQARTLATEKLADARGGRDPAAERRQARDALTVKELAERYEQLHLPKKKARSVAEDRRILTKYVLPALGSRVLTEIGAADISRLHAAMHEAPIMANRVLAVLGTLFGLAEEWGLRPDGTNPCRRVKRYPERRRERFLSEAELARLGTAIAELEREGPRGTVGANALRLLCLTGCRRGEVLGLTWQEVDFERGLLRLADSKTGARTVVLGPPALELLTKLARSQKGERVFPDRRGYKCGLDVELAEQWKRTRAQAGLPDLRIHDLRHTHASVGAAGGLSLHLIGALLGHKRPGTTARYAHLADDPIRAAADRVANRIAAALEGRPGADVVPLRGAE